MQSIFPSQIVLHEYSPTHAIIKTTMADFLKAPLQNWKHNRNPDLIRCKEIAEYYKDKPMDTMFYLACINGEPKILDGMHRYTALHFLEKSAQKDLQDPWWISPIFINIRQATNGECVDLFTSLNKAIPVPEIYVKNTAEEKRIAIETVAADWKKRFKPHFVASMRPIKPHINGDVFMDLLSKIYTKYAMEDRADQAAYLEQKLMEANERVRQNPPKATDKAMEKCALTGCWLFLLADPDA